MFFSEVIPHSLSEVIPHSLSLVVTNPFTVVFADHFGIFKKVIQMVLSLDPENNSTTFMFLTIPYF